MSIARIGYLLSQSQRPSVFTGAGMSRESGLPIYRDSDDAQWHDPAIRRLATVAGFHETPDAVLAYFNTFRERVQATQPHLGHLALAELEMWLAGLPIITQNVDDLHERAGSKQVIHLHGNLMQDRCTRYCRGVPSVIDVRDTSTTCPLCGASRRPNVLLFGEYVHSDVFQQALRVADHSDLMLIIGTTGLVAPHLKSRCVPNRLALRSLRSILN
jgi:NAD-dependent deacetylase